MKRFAALALGAVLALPCAALAAVTLTPVATIGTASSNLVGITHAGDSRLFVIERTGRIYVVKDGAALATPFLDIRASINSTYNERGLLGLAFHPSYATNGFFYTYYTDLSGNLVLKRWHVSANADLADAASGVTMLTIAHTTNQNHNGGQLVFGPDGYLYLGPGDGGSSNDPPCNAQNDGVLLGKLLRLDVDQNVNTSPYYGIPATNPYVGAGNPLDEIWFKGLRNPWRFSFDRSTGDLWIADVGQNTMEEINFIPAGTLGGLNFGWKVMEGTLCNQTTNCTSPPACNSAAYTMPVATYNHTSGRCSITGGFVYRGASAASLYGKYIYADYCSGEIWALDRTTYTSTLVTDQVNNSLFTFGEDVLGELYVSLANVVYRITEPSSATTQWRVM